MTNTATKTYLVGVIERAIAYYEVDAEDARTAAENWDDGEFHDRDDEALDSEGPCNVRVKQPDGAWVKLLPSEWEAEPPAASGPAAILTAVARQHLGISTLDTRRSDSLDFHNVAVWQVQAALKAAFAAGTAESVTTSAALPTRFDAYEIAPCRRFREDGDHDRFYYEPCKPEEADVWTLYGHIPGQGAECVGDFTTREHAEQIYARITGHPYGSRS